MGELFRRIKYLINRRLAAELESDMEFHRETAVRAGRSNFGSTLRMREQSCEAWGWTWLDRLAQDLSYAARTLVRSPGFTVTAVLVLAIGIGVNVAAFSLFNMVALEPLPVRDPGSLVRLQRRSPEIISGEMPYAIAMFYRDHAKTLSGVLTMMGARLRLDDDLEPVKTNFVSANFFRELGAAAAYGRLLDAERDEAGNAPPVVLGHEFWVRRFGADPAVVGKVIHLNRRPVTVVGVEPYGFPSLDGEGAEVWLPITQQSYFVEGSKVLTDVSNGSVHVWGRLTGGGTARQAEQELLGLTNELRKQHPKDIWKDEYIRSDPGGHLHVMEPEMYQVAEMVGVLTLLILAVTCAHLGGLQLARGVAREREMGIRLGLGASAARIFRQLLTESLVLALIGSAAGMLLAWGALKIVLAKTASPVWLSATPDWRVLAFAVAMALMATLLFGFAPALQIARQRQRKSLARQLLVGAQIAASCMLLIVASLLVRASQHALYRPGFRAFSSVRLCEAGHLQRLHKVGGLFRSDGDYSLNRLRIPGEAVIQPAYQLANKQGGISTDPGMPLQPASTDGRMGTGRRVANICRPSSSSWVTTRFRGRPLWRGGWCGTARRWNRNRRRIGVDPSTLARWGRGDKQPAGNFLARVDRFLTRASVSDSDSDGDATEKNAFGRQICNPSRSPPILI
jgi:hypothetical protein